MESEADTLDAIVAETLGAVNSERVTRVIDKDGGNASMEQYMRCFIRLPIIPVCRLSCCKQQGSLFPAYL